MQSTVRAAARCCVVQVVVDLGSARLSARGYCRVSRAGQEVPLNFSPNADERGLVLAGLPVPPTQG
eukprot:scaffold124435_cov60-Phaeocystis_antarctica.AAC.2